MATLITVATMIVCVLLALVILIQNSKGGGLASNFSSGNQIMSVKKTADTLEKATWGFAMGLLVLSLVICVLTSLRASLATFDLDLIAFTRALFI